MNWAVGVLLPPAPWFSNFLSSLPRLLSMLMMGHMMGDVETMSASPQEVTLPALPSQVGTLTTKQPDIVGWHFGPQIPQASNAPYSLRSPRSHSTGQSKTPTALGEGDKNNSSSTVLVSSASVADDSYELELCIPGLKGEKRYPKARVESSDWTQKDYNERFKFVVGEMDRMVKSHPDLRSRSRAISYVHEMVGTSPETTRPCIIVFCRKEDFKILRALFSQRVEKPLFCGKKSLPSRLFGSKKGQPPVAPFEIVYYRTNYDPVARKSADALVLAHSFSDLTWCGSLIQFGARTATLGLTVQIDRIHGVLTVDHLFPSDLSQPTAIALEPDINEYNVLGGDVQGPTVLWIDAGGEYEDGDEYEEEDHLSARGDQRENDISPPGPSHFQNDWGNSSTPEWVRIVPQYELSNTEPYLDWSLTRPASAPNFARANLFFPGGKDSNPIQLSHLMKELRSHRALVIIISGIRGLLRGEILAASAMIGSGPERELCEVWTVLLDSGEGKICKARQTNPSLTVL